MLPADDNDETRTESLEKAIRGARLIVGTFAFALLLFAGVVAGVSSSMKPALAGSPVVAVASGIGGVGLLVGVIVGIVIGRRLQSRVRLGERLSIERISAAEVVSAALVEGPSLLAAVAGMLGGLPYLIITLVGCALLVIQWLCLPGRMRDLAGLGATYTWR